MNKHWYGEMICDLNAPPSSSTGLVIRQWLTVDCCHERPIMARLFGRFFERYKKRRYFIFRHVSGSYDYYAYGEAMCGGYEAIMGYWHYDSEQKRDEVLESFREKGWTIHDYKT